MLIHGEHLDILITQAPSMVILGSYDVIMMILKIVTDSLSH